MNELEHEVHSLLSIKELTSIVADPESSMAHITRAFMHADSAELLVADAVSLVQLALAVPRTTLTSPQLDS